MGGPSTSPEHTLQSGSGLANATPVTSESLGCSLGVRMFKKLVIASATRDRDYWAKGSPWLL